MCETVSRARRFGPDPDGGTCGGVECIWFDWLDLLLEVFGFGIETVAIGSGFSAGFAETCSPRGFSMDGMDLSESCWAVSRSMFPSTFPNPDDFPSVLDRWPLQCRFCALVEAEQPMSIYLSGRKASF